MGFDDNASFRHPEIEALRDEDEEDPIELRRPPGTRLNYVKLDGNIGCMVNGAGLAMATMDIIKLYGGSPANFLDVGGGATRERVTAAFKLILSDPNVEAILVNIFGGITRCDVIAEGVVAAAREVNLHVPLVVRLEGTNVELGRKILSQSGLPIIAADEFRRRRAEGRQVDLGGRVMAIIVDAATTRHLPGLHRRAGHLSFRAGDRLRHQDGRRRDAGKGRQPASRPAGIRHRARGRGRDRLRRQRHLRAAARLPPTRSSRRSTPEIPLVVCITEGIPVHRHGAGEARASRRARRG